MATKICEDHIISELKAPSTYKRILVDSQFWKRPSVEAMISSGKTWGEESGQPISNPKEAPLSDPSTALDITISYDAQNSFGVPLRGERHCSFRGGKDYQLSWTGNLSTNISTDAIFCYEKAVAREQPLICQNDRPERLKTECCLPKDEYNFATKDQR
ncbi:MAG: hypothetical protein RL764_351 [Pseudomonadota bacterium]